MALDIQTNRNTQSWTKREKLGRLLWAVAVPFFRLSPRPLWRWRVWLLKLFGAKIGKRVHLFPSVQVTIPWNLSIGDDSAVGHAVILYALGSITIGERVTVSQGAHICAGSHDISLKHRPLIKPPVKIGQDVWVCADAFIGPGVEIQKSAIVGARSVVTRNVEAFAIVVGNPATTVRYVN